MVSTPAGGKVSIDGDAAGATPLTTKRPAGTYVVTLELPGYAPASRQVDVVGGQIATVNEVLLHAAGYLEVSVVPEDQKSAPQMQDETGEEQAAMASISKRTLQVVAEVSGRENFAVMLDSPRCCSRPPRSMSPTRSCAHTTASSR